jgi:hypothetical protein
MAPTRKKSVNKRFLNEVSPEKEAKSSSKNKQQANGVRIGFVCSCTYTILLTV